MTAPVRQDLLALTPAAIASLANVGLLKRAQKELDEGKAPSVALGEDGVLVATFADGVVARLLPGKALKDCPCTCAAATVCRHRVAAILAYQRQQAAGAPAAPGEEKDGRAWSPAAVDDPALERLLGRAALDRARKLRTRGVLAEVVRGTFVGDSLPRVKLQTSTVAFLVPGDPSYARCDCRQRTGCEHVALAVWAFRVADESDPSAGSLVVEVADRTATREERCAAALDGACQLAAQAVLEGVTRLPPAVAGRFALTRASLERAKVAWPLDVVEGVEEQLEAYGRRSARYAPERVSALLTEVFARREAARAGGGLPSGLVLGSDVALETELDRVSLVAVGARVEEDGEQVRASVFLADPSSQTVLVWEGHFNPVDGKRPDGPALAARSAVGSSLRIASSGRVVSQRAKRKANRLVRFGGTRSDTSVTAGGFDLGSLPDSLVVRDVDAFVARLAAEPPRFLRPRLLAEHVRAFAVGKVELVAYDEGEQAVRARCLDPAGHPFYVQLSYRSVAPTALGALALALADGAARAVVGDGRNAGGALVVEPISVLGERLVALDLEAPSPEAAAALAGLPHAEPRRPADLLERSVATSRSLLAEVAHQGLRALPASWVDRLRHARAELREAGFARAADSLSSLDFAVAAARSTGTVDDEAAAVRRWVDAALRLELIADRL